jgi:hypothetical protein
MNGVGWLTVEAARDAMTEATGVTWRIGSRSNGVLCGSSVLYCGKQKSTGCRAKICLQTGRHDAGVYRVNARKTDLTHTGHDTVVVAAANGKRPHEEPAVEEEEEESSHFRGKRSKLQNVFLEEVQYDDDDDEGDDEYDEDGPVEQPEDDSARALRDSVAHLDCEQIRRLFPKDMTGLTALAYENPEYDLKKRGCVTECRRSVFKRVTTIGSADVFKQALRECERPYFEWWSMFNGEGDDLSPLVYLRVHGVSSLEVPAFLFSLRLD